MVDRRSAGRRRGGAAEMDRGGPLLHDNVPSDRARVGGPDGQSESSEALSQLETKDPQHPSSFGVRVLFLLLKLSTEEKKTYCSTHS